MDNNGSDPTQSGSFQNEPKPVSAWRQDNENQTPAYNDTDYWNKNLNPSDPEHNSTQQPPTPETQPGYSTHSEQTPESTQTENTHQPEPFQGIQTTETNPEPQPQTEVPQNQNMDQTPPPKSKSGTGLMILMVTVVIILLGSTGLFAFQNYQLKKEMESKPSPTPSAEPTPTPDPTADWKTYINEKNQFVLKYPQTNNLEVKKTVDGEDYGDLSNGIRFILDSQSLEKCNGKSCPTKTGIEKIGEYDFTKYTLHNDDPGGSEDFKRNDSITYEYFLSTNVYLLITATYTASDTAEQNMVLNVFNNILSTFKDTSKITSTTTATNCSTGYEKFANANFSFCYPTGMKETAASTSTSVVLENSTDTLKVEQGFQGSWTGSACLAINSITVANYPSKRLTWKKENTDGTCDTAYSSFATMVNEGIFKSPYPYLIQYSKKSGTFTDSNAYTTIESSFVPAVAN